MDRTARRGPTIASREALTVRWVRTDGASISTPGGFPTFPATTMEESA